MGAAELHASYRCWVVRLNAEAVGGADDGRSGVVRVGGGGGAWDEGVDGMGGGCVAAATACRGRAAGMENGFGRFMKMLWMWEEDGVLTSEGGSGTSV